MAILLPARLPATRRIPAAVTNALTGNVTATLGSLMEVHGNDSFAVRLTGALTGYVNLEGSLFMLGGATNPGDAALSIEADVSEFVRLEASDGLRREYIAACRLMPILPRACNWKGVSRLMALYADRQ